MRSFKLLLLCIISFCAFCLSIGSAFAQIPDEITGIKLKEDSLNMAPGEIYRFVPDITTNTVSGAVNISLHLFSSDENVVRSGEELNTIEAVGGGTAEVRVFTAGYEFSAVCSVTVSGEAKSVVAKGSIWEGPDTAQLTKVSVPAMKEFFEMLTEPRMADAASMIAQQTEFRTLVRAVPDKTGALADLMKDLGMSSVYAFEKINTVSAEGTAAQFAELLKNEMVLRIDADEISYAEAVPDTGPLQGQAETISHFSAAYDMGLDGSGTAVVIIDEGVFTGHEQFTGKEGSSVIHEACFSHPAGEEDGMTIIPACANGTEEDLESGWIDSGLDMIYFTHGTHVAAIAAGKDGVAPKADIIAINVFTMLEYECSFFGLETTCSTTGSQVSDQIRAFEYLNGLMENEDIKIASINMSLGGSKQTRVCNQDDREAYFKDWLDRGIITAVASGNESYDGAVTTPACAPSAFAVGALWDSGTPQVAGYSNHSKMVDILAPGTQIRSAVPKKDSDGNMAVDAYEIMNGTSMATPVVAGSIALLRQQFPDASAKQIEDLLTGMTTQNAARGKITKPVLDLANLPAAAELIENGPEVNVFGGVNYLSLKFEKNLLPVNYTVKLYSDPGAAKPLKTVKGRDLTDFKFSKLKTGQIYGITIDYSFPGLEEPHSISLKGMTMKQGRGFTLSLDPDAGSEENPVLKFGWIPEDNAELAVDFCQGNTEGRIETAAAEAEWSEAVYDELVTAVFYKKMTSGEDSFLSLPTSLKILPPGSAEPRFWDVFNGQVYINFDEPAEGLTGREVLITKVINDYDDDFQEIIIDRIPYKAIQFPVSKAPKDLLITGIKEEMDMEVEVRNYVTIGKETYYGPSFKLYWFTLGGNQRTTFYNEVLKYKPGITTMKSSNMAGVTVTAGDGSVTLDWQRNLIAKGYQFQIKPVDPNMGLITKNFTGKTSQDGCTIKGLTNGVVYKMRFRWYAGTANQPLYSSFYPNETTATLEQDNSWEGIYFIPMPVPAVTKINQDGTFVLESDGSLDKLAIVKASGSDPTGSTVLYVDVEKGKNLIDPELEGDERSILLMYAKEYNDYVYYGPAAALNPVPQDSSEMNVGYGAKSEE